MENKPEQTNPSTEPEETEVQLNEPDEREAVEERVRSAVAEQKRQAGNAEPEAEVESTQETKVEGGQSSDVSNQIDSSDTDPNAEVLKVLGNITGRSYSDVEDAKKHIANLNSLVGDKAYSKAREAQRTLDNIVGTLAKKEGVSPEDVLKALSEQTTEETQATPQQPKPVQPSVPEPTFTKESKKDDGALDNISSELERLRDAHQKFELRSTYPDAKVVEDDVVAVAKQKGISYVEAYEKSFKDLVEAKSREESKKNPVVTPSNKIGFDQKKVQTLGAKVIKDGFLDDKQRLVSEVLNLN